MDLFWQDLRLGVRGLLRSPLVAVTAIATLAVGIASTTAVFSIVNAALLQPLQYGNPDRLVLVWMAIRNRELGFGNPPPEVYVRWHDRAQSFEHLGALVDTSFDLRGDPPVRIAGAKATADFFSATEVQPELGRVFTEEEARAGAHVVVLGHAMWKNQFAADPHILDKTIFLSGAPWTVIGVMPATFSFTRNHDLWVPIDINAQQLKGAYGIMPVGKLKRGVTEAQVNAELDAIQQQIMRELPDVGASRFDSARIMPVRNILFDREARRMMLILLASVGLVLLIGCVNVANLLLARGVSRQQEIAVRISLGATRWHIVRQLLLESALLAIVGATTGLALAWLVVHWLATLPVLQAPGARSASIDPAVLAFVAGLTVLTLLASGVLPAWQTSLVSPSESLKSSSAANLGSTGHRRTRSVLVVAEVAFSVVLLVTAGLLLHRFVNLLHASPGFDPANLVTMDLSRSGDVSPEAARNFYNQLLDRVHALPGVESAAVSTTLPMVGWNYGIPARLPGQPKEVLQGQFGMLNVVSTDYFRMLRLPVLHGRTFTSQDTATSAPVVIINRYMARRYFKEDNPVGKALITGGVFDFKAETPREVIGVVGDVMDSGMEVGMADDVYLPFAQSPVPWEYFAVRSNDPNLQLADIRAIVASIDKDQPLEDVYTMQQRVDDSMRSSRFAARLSAVFAMLSLLLAAIGIYGVIAYTTMQRTAEFGVRIALGARPASVLQLVLRSGLKLVLAGAAIGVAAALLLARLVRSVAEYGVAQINVRDPLVFFGALAVILLAALIAMLVPAIRAARIDPINALRYE